MISVIVPVYNIEKYLKRCLDSVVNQTYCDLEIILVNDGSTDCSRGICLQYAKKDSRIKIVEEANQGLSAARNLGIENATGEYITFLDGDDFIDSDMLKILLQNIETFNADVAICDFVKFYSEQHVKNRKSNKYVVKEILPDGFTDSINRNYPKIVSAWGKLYKREIFEQIRFPKGKLHEDAFVLYDWMFQCKKIIFVKEKMYYYFQRRDGITGSYRLQNAQDIMKAWEYCLDFALRREDEVLYQVTQTRRMCIAAASYKKLKGADNENERKRIYEIFYELYQKKELRRLLSKEERIGYFLLSRSPRLYMKAVTLYRSVRK